MQVMHLNPLPSNMNGKKLDNLVLLVFIFYKILSLQNRLVVDLTQLTVSVLEDLGGLSVATEIFLLLVLCK